LKGWESLIAQDQQVIRKETAALAESIFEAGKSRLKIGEHLTKLRDILEPKRMFVKYLNTLHFSRATAYRFIDTYLAAKTILPSPVMQVALMRGTDTINARLVKAFPPPKSTDVAVISTYLDKIAKKERGQSVETDEDQLPELYKRECFNFIRTRWARLPETMSRRQKTAWMNDLRGMTMTLQGVSSLTLEASAIPDDYVRPRGRPRLDSKKEAS
jgi:hypothetical protein